MPLLSVSQHSASQCTARAKSTQQRCLNPAAYGCNTCRLHGARHKSSVKSGENHPNYRHGMETLSAKRKRDEKLAEIRALEYSLIKRGIIRTEKRKR